MSTNCSLQFLIFQSLQNLSILFFSFPLPFIFISNILKIIKGVKSLRDFRGKVYKYSQVKASDWIVHFRNPSMIIVNSRTITNRNTVMHDIITIIHMHSWSKCVEYPSHTNFHMFLVLTESKEQRLCCHLHKKYKILP